MTPLRCAPVLLLPTLIGCQKSVSTPFPAGLEPLEDCSAGLPAAGASGDLPEDAQVAAGDDDDWMYVHLCGYVLTDADAVWDALQDADVITDRRRISDYQVTAQDIEPDYDVSFRIHHVVEDLITVEYDIDWRQGVWQEEHDGVSSVAARFQKTEGSSFIELIEGSILVETVDQDAVSLELVIHHQSLGYDLEDLQLRAMDFYGSLVAAAHGDSLPVYD